MITAGYRVPLNMLIGVPELLKERSVYEFHVMTDDNTGDVDLIQLSTFQKPSESLIRQASASGFSYLKKYERNWFFYTDDTDLMWRVGAEKI